MAEDQAAGLRRIFGKEPALSLVVMGGDGGSGCTSVAVNLALGLAREGRRVGLLDCRGGEGSASSLLGVDVPGLHEALDGRVRVTRVLVQAREHLWVADCAGLASHIARAPGRWRDPLESALGEMEGQLDFLLVDAPRLATPGALWFAAAAEDIVAVVGRGAGGITQAYAAVKRLQAETGRRRAAVLLARCEDADQGERIFGNLSATSKRFLNFSLEYMGWIPEDGAVSEATRQRRPVAEAAPDCAAARAFGAMSATLARRASSGLFGGSYASRLLEAAGGDGRGAY